MPFSFGFGKGTAALGSNKFWSPKQLSPSVWLDASDSASVVLTDGVVSQWSDKSGNNRHATQSTAANRPVPQQRYNLLTYSEQFDNAIWTKIGATVTSNSVVAPDGTTTADTLTETSATSQHGINYTSSGISIVSGTNYIVSFYLKPNGRNIVDICGDAQNGYLGATSTQVNISTGTVISTGSATAVSITNAGNGWYRVSATYTATNTTASPGVYLTVQSYAGNGSSGVYIWGAQVVMADVFPQNTYQRIAAVGTHDTSSNFPTHLLFDGVNDSLNVASWGNVSQPFTRVIVFSPVTMGQAAHKFLLESVSPTALTDIAELLVANQSTITTGENPYTPCLKNNTYIRIATTNNTAGIVHTDGVASATFTRASNNYQTGLAIAWDGAGYNGWAHVRICEIIFIPRVLTADERQKLEGYLAHKWGLQNKLAAEHPHKSTRANV